VPLQNFHDIALDWYPVLSEPCRRGGRRCPSTVVRWEMCDVSMLPFLACTQFQVGAALRRTWPNTVGKAPVPKSRNVVMVSSPGPQVGPDDAPDSRWCRTSIRSGPCRQTRGRSWACRLHLPSKRRTPTLGRLSEGARPSLRPTYKATAPGLRQFFSPDTSPDPSRVSRNATRFSPSNRTRAGGSLARGFSADRHARRPYGAASRHLVPWPTRVQYHRFLPP